MHPIHFEGAVEIGKPENMTDEQCFSIWAKAVDYVYTDINGNSQPTRMWVQAWKPNKEDIEAINRGEPIWVQLHCGPRLAPMALFTVDENGKSNSE